MGKRIVASAVSAYPVVDRRRSARAIRGVAAIVFCISAALQVEMSFAQAASPLVAGAQSTSKPVSGETKSRADAKIAWRKIPSAERQVLANVEKDWEKLSGLQQRRLLAAAKEYPKLTPVEQARFQERLKGWTHLSPEERAAAREKYQTLKTLPPDKQKQLHSRWQQEKLTPAKPGVPVTTPPGEK